MHTQKYPHRRPTACPLPIHTAPLLLSITPAPLRPPSSSFCYLIAQSSSSFSSLSTNTSQAMLSSSRPRWLASRLAAPACLLQQLGWWRRARRCTGPEAACSSVHGGRGGVPVPWWCSSPRWVAAGNGAGVQWLGCSPDLAAGHAGSGECPQHCSFP